MLFYSLYSTGNKNQQFNDRITMCFLVHIIYTFHKKKKKLNSQYVITITELHNILYEFRYMIHFTNISPNKLKQYLQSKSHIRYSIL